LKNAAVVNGVVPVKVATSVAAPTGNPGVPALQLPGVAKEVLVAPVHVEFAAKHGRETLSATKAAAVHERQSHVGTGCSGRRVTFIKNSYFSWFILILLMCCQGIVAGLSSLKGFF